MFTIYISVYNIFNDKSFYFSHVQLFPLYCEEFVRRVTLPTISHLHGSRYNIP